MTDGAHVTVAKARDEYFQKTGGTGDLLEKPIGTGPYIRDVAPNGRSSGNRNSRLPTSMRLPSRRSNAGH